MQTLPAGQVIGARYVIEELLGNGGMGAVYRARHVKVERQFAIKVLHRALLGDEKLVQRFEREAALAGRLHHTNVASVVDVGTTADELPYIAMDFVPGTPLGALLAARGPFAPARVVELAKQLCAGLQHAHELGLVHRDFKPDNVLVEQTPTGREVARIVDWGVAILRDDAGDPDRDRLTTKGIVVGTPHYMAPEQARGGAVDHRADLFSLGLICYELLTGKLPFDGTGVDVARANLAFAPPPMRERAPAITVEPVLEALVLHLLEKKPADRPPNAAAAGALFALYEQDRAACAERLGVPVERPEPPGPGPERFRPTTEVRRIRRSHRIAIAALIAGLLAVLLWVALAPSPRPVALAPTDAAAELVALAAADAVLADAAVAELTPPDAGIVVAELPRPRRVVARPTTGEDATAPVAPSRPPREVAGIPEASEIARLYAAIGRELRALEAAKDIHETFELRERYRWIRINDYLAPPERRLEAKRMLDRLMTDIRSKR